VTRRTAGRIDADLLVIGGGAGGLAAARTGARLGRRVVVVQDGPVGGDCTFTGCVPSKTLISSAARGVGFDEAMARVRTAITRIAATETAEVLSRAGIQVLEGRARFVRARTVTVEGTEITARRVVIATGSAPAIPDIPGLADGSVLTNENVWDLRDAPGSLAIIGGGPIGCELAQAFARLRIAVTLVEAMSRLLPKEEPAAAELIAQVLKRDGVNLRLAATVRRVERLAEDHAVLVLDDGSDIAAEQVLVAVGRRPVTDGLEPERAGVGLDERGQIRTDGHLATAAQGIYAVGDVTGRLPFTHAADEMGRLAAINALRRPLRLRFRDDAIPWVTFTDPEVARVGLSEAQAARQGGRVAVVPLGEVDRAITAAQEDGFIKLIAGPRRLTGNLAGGRLLGATIVAPRAGEMIHEVALAMRAAVFTGRLAQTVHAYPTWSSGLRRAAAQFFFEIDGRRARPAEPS
jgi:pyruvate/2-oxoglutarate dehydrogenase complex dihydrolipoamide dehydrogenase (E3) component